MNISSPSLLTRLAAVALMPLAVTACGAGTADSPAATTAHGTAANATDATLTSGPVSAAVADGYTVDLPDGVDSGTPAAAAWEALMGADGEYAAYATYGAVIDRYGDVEPYATIQTQEGHHIDALTRQLERLGVEVPDNPYLGEIDAPESLQAAAENWATGEVANVAMYDALLADATDDAKLTKVFTNLRRSSQESHLPMFTAAAASGGTLDEAAMADFEAQHDSMHDSMDGEMHDDMDHDS